jgi:predicted porin
VFRANNRHPTVIREIYQSSRGTILKFPKHSQMAEGVMVVKRSVVAVLSGAVIGASALTSAPAMADGPMVTKAPMWVAPAATGPANCPGAYEFFLTNCALSWWGVTFYGTVDLGATYQTHGAPFDRNFPTGASYLLGAGGTNATNRNAGFGLGPNGLSQSNVGVKVKEGLGGGWSFIAQGELAFDPYSLLLANAPQALQNGIGVPENQQALPFDSSRWGWLNTNQYVGVSSPVYGTLTFGRQNVLQNDGISVYDPMGGSYAFSPIGYSGKTAGAGDTENARWNTAIKYRLNIANFRFGVMGQPIGGSQGGYNSYNPNNGAVGGDIGGDFKNLGPGTLSVDLLGTYERDAVNIGTTFIGQAVVLGWPTTFPGGAASGLKATISNNTSFMALTKYSFGSWGDPVAPIVGKAPPAPSGPSGIPLTLYAGYEWVQFANPSDSQTTSFRDDGFTFNFVNAGATALSANGTTVANNAFNAACGSGAGCTNEIFQVMWTGAKYGVTRDLDIIGGYYHFIQSTYVNGVNCSNGNAASNSRCQGWFDTYSMVLDWRFLPKWDAYVGAMYSAAFGGLANGDITRNNLATTAGVRFRF